MTIQMKFFVVPVRNMKEAEEELNRFLAGVRLVQLHREFVSHGENSFWSIAVEFIMGSLSGSAGSKRRSRIDYREVLSQEDFALFARLREWRKQQAMEEAVPVYSIFTNEQLATLVEGKVRAKTGFRKIEGIGQARIEKYGDAVLKILTDLIPDPDGNVEE